MAFAAHINLPLSARNEAMRHKGEMLHRDEYHITVCAICAGVDAREVAGDLAVMAQLVQEGWVRGVGWICPTCAKTQQL